jgi:plastocyanin
MRAFLLLPLLLISAPALAGDLAVTVFDSAGKPVADAVATFYPARPVAKRPISFPWAAVMAQEGIAFVPHVLIVPVGATVRFPNRDKVRHHVYSFSKPAKFEMKLFGKDETRSYTFTSAGAVALGCNIHDSMSGFIKVVDTPFAGKSDGAGRVRLSGVPTGPGRVVIWHPLMRAKDNEIILPATVGAAGVTVTNARINLRQGG